MIVGHITWRGQDQADRHELMRVLIFSSLLLQQRLITNELTLRTLFAVILAYPSHF